MTTFFCDKCGKPFEAKVTGIFCSDCCGKLNRKTNADMIRDMSDEELAKFLSSISIVATRMSLPPYLTATQQAQMHESEYRQWRIYLSQYVEDE